nr:hypothetical protein XNW1_4200002 [Xenorhabdus nematophila str. Websteri]
MAGFLRQYLRKKVVNSRPERRRVRKVHIVSHFFVHQLP